MNKICTSLEQSKKLIELGIDVNTADMYYGYDYNSPVGGYEEDAQIIPQSEFNEHFVLFPEDIPAWSLAALHCVASTYCSRLEITLRADKKYNVFAVKDDFVFRSFDDHPDGFDNLVDACYEMVLKLKEKNLL